MDSGNLNDVFISLEELNACNYKPLLKVKEMEPLKAYSILSCGKVSTRFGQRVVLELEDHQMFLPQRFNNISTNTIEKLNEGGFLITCQGTSINSYNLIFSKAATMANFYTDL